MPKALYERELRALQAKLVDMQAWVEKTGARVVVIFEGRDAAGKGSAIKRVTEYLNPRVTRIVALPTPSALSTTMSLTVSSTISRTVRSSTSLSV